MSRFENARRVWIVLVEHANRRIGPVYNTDVREPLGLDSGQMLTAMKIIHLHCKANRLPQLDALAIGRGKDLPTHQGAPRTKLAHQTMLTKVWATKWDLKPPERWSIEGEEQDRIGSESGAPAE